MERIDRENKPFVILGDFNLDLLKYDSHFDTDNFLDIMLSYRFQPHIVQPTRITDHSSTLIDNIFFNSIDEIFTVIRSPSKFPYNNYHNLTNKIKLFKREYSNFNENLFVEECKSVNCEEIVFLESDPK